MNINVARKAGVAAARPDMREDARGRKGVPSKLALPVKLAGFGEVEVE